MSRPHASHIASVISCGFVIPLTLVHEVEYRPNAMVCIDAVGTSDASRTQDPRERCQLKVGTVTRCRAVQEAEYGRDAESLPITAEQKAQLRVALQECGRS